MTHLKTNHENNHNIIDKTEIELCVWCEIKSEIFFLFYLHTNFPPILSTG